MFIYASTKKEARGEMGQGIGGWFGALFDIFDLA